MDLGLGREGSLKNAAGRAGIQRTYFADAERGVRNVGIKNVVAIARGLDVTPSKLLKKIR